jgi:predicted amidohydrolase YtcJ
LTDRQDAALVTLDRDYQTMPVDDILNIKPVLTMVGGKVVYERTQ